MVHTVADPLDFSDWEAQAHQRAQLPRAGLNLRFFSDGVQNAAKSIEAGRPIYDVVDYVEINVPGSKDTVIKDMAVEKRFQEQYAMWKKTQEQPLDGTPLTMVPFLNIAQIKEYQALNVNTLEQLAELGDQAVQKLGPGTHDARKKAKAYMDAAKDSAVTQKAVAENESLKREIARLQSQMAGLTHRIEALMTGSSGLGQGERMHSSALTEIVVQLPPEGAPSGFDIKTYVDDAIRKALGK